MIARRFCIICWSELMGPTTQSSNDKTLDDFIFWQRTLMSKQWGDSNDQYFIHSTNHHVAMSFWRFTFSLCLYKRILELELEFQHFAKYWHKSWVSNCPISLHVDHLYLIKRVLVHWYWWCRYWWGGICDYDDSTVPRSIFLLSWWQII